MPKPAPGKTPSEGAYQRINGLLFPQSVPQPKPQPSLILPQQTEPQTTPKPRLILPEPPQQTPPQQISALPKQVQHHVTPQSRSSLSQQVRSQRIPPPRTAPSQLTTPQGNFQIRSIPPQQTTQLTTSKSRLILPQSTPSQAQSHARSAFPQQVQPHGTLLSSPALTQLAELQGSPHSRANALATTEVSLQPQFSQNIQQQMNTSSLANRTIAARNTGKSVMVTPYSAQQLQVPNETFSFSSPQPCIQPKLTHEFITSNQNFGSWATSSQQPLFQTPLEQNPHDTRFQSYGPPSTPYQPIFPAQQRSIQSTLDPSLESLGLTSQSTSPNSQALSIDHSFLSNGTTQQQWYQQSMPVSKPQFPAHSQQHLMANNEGIISATWPLSNQDNFVPIVQNDLSRSRQLPAAYTSLLQKPYASPETQLNQSTFNPNFGARSSSSKDWGKGKIEIPSTGSFGSTEVDVGIFNEVNLPEMQTSIAQPTSTVPRQITSGPRKDLPQAGNISPPAASSKSKSKVVAKPTPKRVRKSRAKPKPPVPVSPMSGSGLTTGAHSNSKVSVPYDHEGERLQLPSPSMSASLGVPETVIISDVPRKPTTPDARVAILMNSGKPSAYLPVPQIHYGLKNNTDRIIGNLQVPEITTIPDTPRKSVTADDRAAVLQNSKKSSTYLPVPPIQYGLKNPDRDVGNINPPTSVPPIKPQDAEAKPVEISKSLIIDPVTGQKKINPHWKGSEISQDIIQKALEQGILGRAYLQNKKIGPQKMRELRMLQWKEKALAEERAKKRIFAPLPPPPSQSLSPAPEESSDKKTKKALAKGKGKGNTSSGGTKSTPSEIKPAPKPTKASLAKIAKKLKEEQEKEAAEIKAREREVAMKQWAEDLEALDPYLPPQAEPGDIMPVGGFDPWENGQFKMPVVSFETIKPPIVPRNTNMPDFVQNRPNVYGYRGVTQWKKNTTYYEDQDNEESEAKAFADARERAATEEAARIRTAVNGAIKMLEELRRNQLESSLEDQVALHEASESKPQDIEHAVILRKRWVKERLAARCHVYIQQCTTSKGGSCGHPACKRSFQHGQYRVSLEPSEWTKPWVAEGAGGVTYGADGEVIMAIPDYLTLNNENDEEVSGTFCVSCFEELLLRATETGPITSAVISGTLPIDIRPWSPKDGKSEENAKGFSFKAWINPSPICQIYSVVHPENRYDSSGNYTLDDDTEKAIILWKKKLSDEGTRHLKEKFGFLQDKDEMETYDEDDEAEDDEVEDEEEDGPAVKLFKESGDGIFTIGLAECFLRAGKHPAPHMILPSTTGRKLVKKTEKAKQANVNSAPVPTTQHEAVISNIPLVTEKKRAKRKADGDGRVTKQKKSKMEVGASPLQTEPKDEEISVHEVKGRKKRVADDEPIPRAMKRSKSNSESTAKPEVEAATTKGLKKTKKKPKAAQKKATR